MNDHRSLTSPYLSKLITLINTKPLHDFLTDLHQVLSVVYNKYASHTDLMTFEQFFEFTKHYDIFPKACSKACLFQIFHSLANQREQFQNMHSGVNVTKDTQQINVQHILSPPAQEKPVKVIDKAFFTQAVALSALYTTDQDYMDLIHKYDSSMQISDALEKASLSLCLAQVQRMYDSNGRAVANRKLSHVSLSMLKSTHKQKDIISLFIRKRSKYGWWFEQEEEKKNRSHQKPKMTFDQVMNFQQP